MYNPEVKEMWEFLSSHWHCVLPLAVLAVWLLCTRGKTSESEKDGL
jgi:hypothetical protein